MFNVFHVFRSCVLFSSLIWRRAYGDETVKAGRLVAEATQQGERSSRPLLLPAGVLGGNAPKVDPGDQLAAGNCVLLWLREI